MSADADVRARLAGLSSERRELLEKLVDARPATTIPRRPEGARLPLSFGQQRLWFLDRYEAGSVVYNECNTLRIRFPLDAGAWRQALQEIVRRHEILRTTFHAEDGEPTQVVSPAADVDVPVIDLRRLPAAEREAEARRLTAAEGFRPFDLATGPLMRASLIRLDVDDHVFVLTMHHIVCDGWSMGVFILEFTALYWSFVQGLPSPLRELPIQYADFALWQRQALRGPTLAPRLAYWKRQLADLPTLNLPTDRARPAAVSYQGARLPLAIPVPLHQSLAALGQRHGATLFMTLTAAFKALLYRYSGQEDIVIGFPVAGRDRKELEPLIGFFVDTMVLRTSLAGDPSFVELLRRVREVVLGAFANQDTPFELLVDELQPRRDQSRNPLFQVVFQFFRAPEVPGVPKEHILPFAPVHSGVSKFDLMFHLIWTEGQLQGYVEYRTDLFDRVTIERMAAHFHRLLDGIVADPEMRISQVEILDPEERRRLLVDWNHTRTQYPRDSSLHELFEAQAARAPESVAVVFGDEEVTYGELNRRADRLARRLRASGVEPDTRVGLCLDPSVEMVVAMLGILKVGAAYVPLDPTYPGQRLALMIDDARISVVATQERLRGRLAEGAMGQASVVVCDDGGADGPDPGGGDQPCQGAGTRLAYVIYTSGSTGQPKGVEVPHRGVTRVVVNTDYLSITPMDRVAQASTCTFDAATFEIWGALLNGATLVGILRDVLLSPSALAAELRRRRITVLFLTTDLFNQVVAAVPDAFATLRALLFGGSAVDPRRVREVLAHGPPGELLHVYGPTESTTFATWYRVDAVPEGASTVPIGRPVANTQAYVLDGYLNPRPVGVPGELYLGGDGLARGYLNHPELTASRFIPNPFDSGLEPRLYKTGDVVRWDAAGSLEFLGRLDDQLKIRGFRVEPGEVEAVLREHPAVHEAAVVAREDTPGDRRLVAYVANDASDQVPDLPVSLREYCRTRLPQYMVPATFVRLDRLPLTSSGKIDRAALPAPSPARPRPEGVDDEPRTEIERGLVAVWARLLGVERVGIHDNFFELGGDSILGIQLVVRAKEAGLHLATKQLFENQTIAELASVVEASPRVTAEQGAVIGAVPLTPIQQWFFAQDLEAPHHFNQGVLLELEHCWDSSTLVEVVGRLLEHHDALRARFQPSEAGWQQAFAEPGGDVPLSVVDLSALPVEAHAAAIEAHAAAAQGSLHLAHGPLLRVTYFDRGAERSARLLMIVHHLVVDTVSWRILLEDLLTAYGQRATGQSIRLPDKTSSFRSWAETLVEHGRDDRLRRELTHWLHVAGDGVRPLPTDDASGVNTVASARTVSVALSAEETRELTQRATTSHRVDVSEALLVALGQALARWLGQGGLLVDLEGHGREGPFEGTDVTRTVGWFTSIYPVRLELREMAEIGEGLRYVKDVLRKTPNRGIGYGLLRWLSSDPATRKALNELPAAQISFNYLGRLAVPGVIAGAVRIAPESAGPARSPKGRRAYLIEIDVTFDGDVLRTTFTYSERAHSGSVIAKLADEYHAALRVLIGRGDAVQSVVPADFPGARLSEAELERIRRIVDRTKPIR